MHTYIRPLVVEPRGLPGHHGSFAHQAANRLRDLKGRYRLLPGGGPAASCHDQGVRSRNGKNRTLSRREEAQRPQLPSLGRSVSLSEA